MQTAHLQRLVAAALAPEVRLADAPPLTLTRNFGWVFAFCLTLLLVLPLSIAWTASVLLN